jgi:fucose permease
VQGWVSDTTGSINYAYVVPLACFAVIAIYSAFGKDHAEPATI